MLSERGWGDGVGDRRPHVIKDISLAYNMVLCGPCDVIVRGGSFLSLDRAWTDHRGLKYHPPRYRTMATDSEVTEFLRAVENPDYVSVMAGSETVTPPADPDALADLIEHVLERQAQCTCATTGIEGCPNRTEDDR